MPRGPCARELGTAVLENGTASPGFARCSKTLGTQPSSQLFLRGSFRLNKNWFGGVFPKMFSGAALALQRRPGMTRQPDEQ